MLIKDKYIDDIELQIKEVEDKLDLLFKERDLLLARTLLQCMYCNQKHMIKDLTYIQGHWYTSPSGCTEGDYWNEDTTEFSFICPNCKERNRCFSFANFQDKRVEAIKFKRLFKNVKDVYSR